MITKQNISDIQKQFEKEPSLLRKDEKFAQQYLITQMLDRVTTSINALDGVVEPGSDPEPLQKLKDVWHEFLKNACLPV
jgi:hypothetical protein